MRVIGITGGVGSGKTEILNYLGNHYDSKVIKADDVGYILMRPGRACYAPVVRLFGQQITRADGELDRKRIAEVVFEDGEKLAQLNAIVHPAVKDYIMKSLERERAAGTPFVFIESALLIEDKYNSICDELWYIYADADVRRRRLKKERGYSDRRIDGIMKNQLSEDEYYDQCDCEINNSGSFRETVEQIRQRMNDYGVM